jgi:glycosyltransferase involved in cell wall biosynthesis
MRILIGMPDKGSLGGPNASEPPIIGGLRRMGIEIEETVYVYGDSLTKTNISERVIRVIKTARRLRRKVKENRFDLIHLNTAFDLKALLRDTVTLYYLRSSKSKVFLKIHGSDEKLLRTKHPIWRLFIQNLFNRVDGIGVISKEEGENFVRAGMDQKKVFVVKNVVEKCVDQGHFNLIDQLNLEVEIPKLLFISRFIRAKGLIDVIRACRILKDRGRKFMLLCVGDGPAREEAESEVKRLNLQEFVRFFGYISEEQTSNFYLNSTMLLFPTYHIEGLPMVILKSIAAGLPIITTRIRGAADYLCEPENCLWVEPQNSQMLAEKVMILLDNSELRNQMKYNNQRLSEMFNPERVASEFAEVYLKVIGRKADSIMTAGYSSR